MKILLASKNLGKLREFQQLLDGIDLIPWPIDAPDIPEDGAFFQDNAIQKATFAKRWFAKYGESHIDSILADDSGLCIDALWGGPGVLTARFGNNLNQYNKNKLILSKLPPDKPRSARFVCVLSWMPSAGLGEPCIFSGSIEGTIALEARGTYGFGYDSIFIPNGFQKTLGELTNNIKQKISHRNKAIQALLTAIDLKSDSLYKNTI
jgi:XTP/dITP diphosphohydrolase